MSDTVLITRQEAIEMLELRRMDLHLKRISATQRNIMGDVEAGYDAKWYKSEMDNNRNLLREQYILSGMTMAQAVSKITRDDRSRAAQYAMSGGRIND